MRIDRQLFQQVAALRIANPGRATGLRQGDRRSAFLGRGVEFADYRPYHEGDDLRLVDWNVYARLEQVLVRLFHEDRNLSVRVLLDATASMGFGTPRKADHAAELAAAVALVALLHRDSVTLACLGGHGPQTIVKGHNTGAFTMMLDLLERVEPAETGDLSRLLRARVEGSRTNRAVLLTDLLVEPEEREATLRVLAACSHAPVLLHVLGRDELEPDLSDGARVIDSETGEEIVIRGGPAAAREYADALAAWQDEIKARCAALRIQYVPAHTTVPAGELLTGALLRGRVVESAFGGVA